MRPIMLKWVAKVAKEVNLPISATGGTLGMAGSCKGYHGGREHGSDLYGFDVQSKGFGMIPEYIEGLECS